VVGGEAALTAANALRERLLDLASALLKVERGALDLAGGAVRENDGARSLSFAELGGMMHFRQHLLPAGMAANPMVWANVVPAAAYLVANGIQASLIELDPDSGFIKPLRHWVVEDCGRVINPLLAGEQIRGGVVQGLGAALFEECRYDERGQLQNATLADYLVPMAADMPDIVVEHVHTPAPGTLLGANGIGEAGTHRRFCRVPQRGQRCAALPWRRDRRNSVHARAHSARVAARAMKAEVAAGKRLPGARRDSLRSNAKPRCRVNHF